DYPASLYQRIWSFAGEGRGTGTPPLSCCVPQPRGCPIPGGSALPVVDAVAMPGLAVDVGCGTGQATKVLATHFDRVVGTSATHPHDTHRTHLLPWVAVVAAFDPSPKQVEAATKIGTSRPRHSPTIRRLTRDVRGWGRTQQITWSTGSGWPRRWRA